MQSCKTLRSRDLTHSFCSLLHATCAPCPLRVVLRPPPLSLSPNTLASCLQHTPNNRTSRTFSVRPARSRMPTWTGTVRIAGMVVVLGWWVGFGRVSLISSFVLLLLLLLIQLQLRRLLRVFSPTFFYNRGASLINTTTTTTPDHLLLPAPQHCRLCHRARHDPRAQGDGGQDAARAGRARA